MSQLTYSWLFIYLERLGFQDKSPSDFERVFEHPEQGTLFAFTLQGDDSLDRPLRGADLTSVQFRLEQLGLLTGSLADLADRSSQVP